MAKLQGIQVLRGLAASLVVVNHLQPIEAKYLAGSRLLADFHFGHSGVDLFFVISGFIIALASQSLFGSARDAAYFLKRRLIRIVPAYWFFTTLVLAVYLFNPAVVNSSATAPPNILASYLFIPTGTYFLLLVGWTLAYEVYFYLVWSGLLLGRRATAFKILPVFFLASVAVNLYFRFESPILKLATNPLILEFALGVLICQLYLKFRIQNSLLLGAILMLGIAALVSNHFVNYNVHRLFRFGVPAATIFFAVVFLEKNHRIPWPRPLIALGDASYSLYLSHVLVLSALGRGCRFAGLERFTPAALFLISGYIICCAVAWCSYKWLELPCTNALNRRFAEKPTPVYLDAREQLRERSLAPEDQAARKSA